MKYIFSFVLLLLSLSCDFNQSTRTNNYADNVGDIAFDPKQDNPDFQLCGGENVPQHYSFGYRYKAEKPAMIRYFKNEYAAEKYPGQNGYLTIRFVVNCKGATDRFRVQEMGFNYKAKQFNTKLVEELLTLCKQADFWKLAKIEDKRYDYYHYLSFKIVDGNIEEILP